MSVGKCVKDPIRAVFVLSRFADTAGSRSFAIFPNWRNTSFFCSRPKSIHFWQTLAPFAQSGTPDIEKWHRTEKGSHCLGREHVLLEQGPIFEKPSSDDDQLDGQEFGEKKARVAQSQMNCLLLFLAAASQRCFFSCNRSLLELLVQTRVAKVSDIDKQL